MLKDERKRIRLIVYTILIFAIILTSINYNLFFRYDAQENIPLKVTEKEAQEKENSYVVNEALIRNYIILYDENSQLSVSLANNMEETLAPMKQAYKVVSVNNLDTNSIKSNDTIMLALTAWEPYVGTIDYLLLKVSEGARLFIGYIPINDAVFVNYSRKLGIYAVGEQVFSDSMVFKGDTIIGLTNELLQSKALVTELNVVSVVEQAKVQIENKDNIIVYYTYPYGSGRIGAYTADNLHDRQQHGLIAGMLATLEDDLVYPIIQSGVLFLDDFPSPMVGYNDKVNEEYGMDVESFICNIWWPDVLALAKKYGIVYTGAVITTYNGIVNAPLPEEGGLDSNMIYFYGNEVIREGGEICWHGYNHQPLKFDHYIDEKFSKEYKVWPSIELAEEGVNIGLKRFEEAFPNYILHGYVPPSNVISPEGERLLNKVFKEAVIICGIYMEQEPDAPAYDYKEEDGIIYFPRIESGCFLTDSVKYATSCALTHVGVFSHFIHPDDVLDEERSYGKSWFEMRLEYEKFLEFLSSKYPFIRMETISEAGQHVMDWDNMQMKTVYNNEDIKIGVTNNDKPYYLILRTNKEIIPAEEYDYQKIDKNAYLIHSEKNHINIELKVRD